jgi:ATP-dependent Lon protease
VRWDPETKNMATIGCCAEILQHQTQEDDRSNIVTLGQQRFRVLNIIRHTPFMVGLVSWVEDEPVVDDLEDLASQVRKALQDVVDLSGKLLGNPSTLPDDLPDLPRELSFWIGGHLGGPVADQQQLLLEMTSTADRLQREFELLDHTRRQLAARTVLQDTLRDLDDA